MTKGGENPPKHQETNEVDEAVREIIEKFKNNPKLLDYAENRADEKQKKLNELEELSLDEVNALFDEAAKAVELFEQISNNKELADSMRKANFGDNLESAKYSSVDLLEYYLSDNFLKEIKAEEAKNNNPEGQQETQDEQDKSKKTEQVSEDAEVDERSQKIAEMRKALEEDNLLGKCLRIRHNLNEDNIGSDRSIKQYENTKNFIKKYFSEFSVEDYAKHGFDNPVSIEEAIGTPIREMPAAKAKLEAMANGGGEDNAEAEKAKKVAEALNAIRSNRAIAWRMEKSYGITENNIEDVDLDKLDEALKDCNEFSKVIDEFGGLDNIMRQVMGMGNDYEVDDSEREGLLEVLNDWGAADEVRSELPRFLGIKTSTEERKSPEDERAQKVAEVLDVIKNDSDLAKRLKLEFNIDENTVERVNTERLTECLAEARDGLGIIKEFGAKKLAEVSGLNEDDIYGLATHELVGMRGDLRERELLDIEDENAREWISAQNISAEIYGDRKNFDRLLEDSKKASEIISKLSEDDEFLKSKKLSIASLWDKNIKELEELLSEKEFSSSDSKEEEQEDNEIPDFNKLLDGNELASAWFQKHRAFDLAQRQVQHKLTREFIKEVYDDVEKAIELMSQFENDQNLAIALNEKKGKKIEDLSDFSVADLEKLLDELKSGKTKTGEVREWKTPKVEREDIVEPTPKVESGPQTEKEAELENLFNELYANYPMAEGWVGKHWGYELMKGEISPSEVYADAKEAMALISQISENENLTKVLEESEGKKIIDLIDFDTSDLKKLIRRLEREVDNDSSKTENDESQVAPEVAKILEEIENNPTAERYFKEYYGFDKDDFKSGELNFEDLKNLFEQAKEAAKIIDKYGAIRIAKEGFEEVEPDDIAYRLELDDLKEIAAYFDEVDNEKHEFEELLKRRESEISEIDDRAWKWYSIRPGLHHYLKESEEGFDGLKKFIKEVFDLMKSLSENEKFMESKGLSYDDLFEMSAKEIRKLSEEAKMANPDTSGDDTREPGGEGGSDEDDEKKPPVSGGEPKPVGEGGDSGKPVEEDEGGGEDGSEKSPMGKVETTPVPKDVLVSRLALSEAARKKMVEDGVVDREDLSVVTAYLSGLEQSKIEELYADISDKLGEAPKTKEEQDAFKELVTKFENNLEVFDWLVAHDERIKTPDDLKKLSPEEAQALFELGKDILEIQKEAVKDPELMARFEKFHKGMDAESLKTMDPVEVRRIFKQETLAMEFAELIGKNKDIIEEVLRNNGQTLEFTSVEDLIANKSYEEIEGILKQYKDAGGIYDDLDLEVLSWQDKMENKAKLEKYQALILGDTKAKEWIRNNVEGGLDAVWIMGFDELRQVIQLLEENKVIEKTLETKLEEQDVKDLCELFKNGAGRNWILKVHPNLTAERIAAMSLEELKALNDEYEKSKERGFIAVNLACTKEAKELARQLAMKRYEEEIKQKGFIKRMVYNNFMRRATIAKYEKEVLDTIRQYQETGENGGSVEGYWSRDDSIQRFVEAFMQGSESVLLGESETLQGYVIDTDEDGNEIVRTRDENGEHILRGDEIENDPNAKATIMLRDAIRDYAGSKGSKKDEKKFRAELEKIKETLGQTDEISVDNYMELAASARERAQHEKNLDNIMDGFTFINGKAERGIQTESFKTKSEKIVEKLFGENYTEKHPILSKIVNTETALAAVDTALAVGAFFFKKAGGLIPVAGRAAAGAVVSGLKEKGRAEQDFRNAMRAAAYGETLQTDNKYAEKVKEVMEANMHSAESLTKMLNDAIIGGDIVQMVGAYEQVEGLMKASEENNIDLISYSSPSQVSTERMAINLSLAEIKAKLREEFGNNFTDRIAYQNAITEYKKDLAEDNKTYLDGNQIAEKIDSSRKKIVAKRVGAKAAKTFAISASIGLAVSEVTAFFDDSREGIVEGIIHKVSSAGESDAVNDVMSEVTDNVPEGVPAPHYSQEAEDMLHGHMPTKTESLNEFMQEHGTGPVNRDWASGEDYNVFHDSARGFFSGYTDNAVDAAGNHIDIRDALDNGHFKVLWSPIEGDGNPIELEFDRMADGINVENLRVPGGSEALNDLLMAKKGLIEFGVESTGSNGESVMTMLSSWPGERVSGSELFDVVDMNRAQELAQEISNANALAQEAAIEAAKNAAANVASEAAENAGNAASEIAENAPGMFLDGSNGALNAASYAATALGDMMSNANRRSAPTSERSDRVAESFRPSSNTYSEVLTHQEDAERVELKDLVDPSNAYAVDKEKLQAYLLQERGSMPTHEMNRLLVWAETWNDPSKKEERQKLMNGEMSRDYDTIAAFSVLQTFGILPERHMYEKPVDIAPMQKTAFEADISEWGKDTDAVTYLKQKGKTDYAVHEIMESVNTWKGLSEDTRSQYRYSDGNGGPNDTLVATLRTEGLLPPAEKAAEPNEFGGQTEPFKIDDSDPVKLNVAFEKVKAESRSVEIQTMELNDFNELIKRWNGYSDNVRMGAVVNNRRQTTRQASDDFKRLSEMGFVELK